MNSPTSSIPSRQCAILASLALAGVAAISLPGKAMANSSANATILNVVRVDYTDVSGSNSFAANASSSVTVNLVKAPLNVSGAPSGANGNPGLTCLPAIDTASGGSVSALYALTATANGQDTYKLSITYTPHNVNNISVTYNTLTYTGASDALTPANPSPATRVLGSAIPTRIVNATTLEFPGGALSGFAVNDIAIVQTTAGKRAFLVTAVSAGQAPVFSHVGNTAYTDATGAYTQAEVKGTLTLGAYVNQTITLNSTNDTTFGGGGIAPAFTTVGSEATLGMPVGEMILVKVSVQASTNSQTDGTVDYVLTTTDSANGNESKITCTASTFKAPTLSIKKEARNFSTSGSFAATATGNPGQILEYRITVTNSGGQASSVVVTDAVPSYTTLVTHGGAYGSGGGTVTDMFAQISDGSNTVTVTPSAVDSEIQPLAGGVKTGYGKAIDSDTVITPAVFDASSNLTFYLGNTSSNGSGGLLPYCSNGIANTLAACTAASATWIDTLTIIYQVKID